MKRKNSKEFFSIFQRVKPRLNHLNLCLQNNEKVFHRTSIFSEQCKRSTDKGIEKSAKLPNRRISVFGSDGNKEPLPHETCLP